MKATVLTRHSQQILTVLCLGAASSTESKDEDEDEEEEDQDLSELFGEEK